MKPDTTKDTTEHEAATADVLASATAALANEAMRHIAKICGERTNLMLAISTIVTHRFEMLYRTEFMKAFTEANKPKEPEMKYEECVAENTDKDIPEFVKQRDDDAKA